MTAPARLLALRLQGFKSFAERTVVEFGPGISAVVGPNGSGKSNLADGLRWALGEQGRALRSRKSEDVIWAGSERRAALGMADVTLVLDNSDGLLPVEFSVLELGRRLYRSGENDYLLNRQRVRLRDLVDLLDAANLADNAFLFIGQGMVDQALSLRPEERRPLFEEVAGVRRHERRRRKAEEQLTESEANLARVEDVLAELRPQARRLAAQAEQQATRATAGTDLAAALIVAGHGRWYEASARLGAASSSRERATTDADRATADLRAAEEAVAAVAAQLSTRIALEAERRDAHEAARASLTALQLREARLVGDLEAIDRDRRRLNDERSTAQADLELQRRALAQPVPPTDPALDAAVAAADRALGDAMAELAQLRAAQRAEGDELAAIRRADSARQAELETARRQLIDVERRSADERSARELTAARHDAAVAEREAAARRLAEAISAEAQAVETREAARLDLERAEEARTTASDRATAAGSWASTLSATLGAIESRLEEEESRGIARAARKHGGRRVDEDLGVDTVLRGAVEAALAEIARGYVLGRGSVAAVAGERGVVVVGEATGAVPKVSAAERSFIDRVSASGGGSLRDAVRRDPTGAASAVLARAAWLPDLASCLAVQPDIPPGWLLVPRDGGAVISALTVTLGTPDSPLERRDEAARLRADVERATAERDRAAADTDRAREIEAAARSELERRRAEEAAAAASRRRAEEAERVAASTLDAIAREASWHEAQAARLDGDARRLRAAVEALDTADRNAAAAATGETTGVEARAVATWEARVSELREQRDRASAERGTRDRARQAAESARARAEASAAIDEERIARAEREASTLADRAAKLESDREILRTELARVTATERDARAALGELRAADTADRERLATAERRAAEARDRLRTADDRLRSADHAELEARLGLEAIREQLLVELAGLGEVGRDALVGLTREADAPLATAAELSPPSEPTESDEAAALEAALDAVSTGWSAAPPDAEPPSIARLATLRRRYHELGAANPFAVEEYAALRERLETLEAQDKDLRAAIAGTRQLIEELNALIAEQFGTTFRALEAAFDRQFNQLFGGGYAKLTLTDPDDPSASGVDIVARPPGKKAQQLSMLSGGERALTAVALLFAMLEVRPVPFCVLDEVDAALDEANVGRFSDALRGLADRTQFIVITHNRGTIEAADALYGVTVGDDSVSRVISLRLDEARAIADQQREPAVAGVG
ncbi:MAG: chromosome segregation protein SMC [Chloroflexota bacterium]